MIRYTKETTNRMRKIGNGIISLVLIVGLLHSNVVTTVFAKEIGNKNEEKQKECVAIINGDTPKDASGNQYEDVLGNGSVYKGGNAKSAVIEPGGDPGVTNVLDNDPDDFASVLPYGNVFVNKERISWTNPNNFIIDIQDDRFKWIAVDDKSFTDAKGFSTINNPLGKPLKGGSLDKESKNYGFIAYVGELKPYHADFKAATDDAGYTNVIKPEGEGEYLYRITYLDAATLPNGMRGNVVMTMKRVEIETSLNVSEDNPHIVTTEDGTTQYEYTKAILPIQSANSLKVSGGVRDSEGNYVNEEFIIAKSSDEVQAAVNAANEHIPSGKIGSGIVDDKMMRHTSGGAYTFEIKIVDSEGNDVKGTMAYAAKDLDLPSYQNVWGRSGDTDPFMYAEGLTILDNTLSYAVIPEYDHNDGTQLTTGWVPSSTTGSLNHPLHVSGGTGTNADGVRFSSTGKKIMRDKKGKWDDVFFGWKSSTAPGQILDFSWDNINNSRVRYSDYDDIQAYIASHSATAWDNVRKQLAGKIKDDNDNIIPWNQITVVQILDFIGEGSYSIERNDAGFDSGFAVLIDPSGTNFRWTGSTYQSGSAVTTLFDTTLFTYVETTRGTGGGIYVESYDVSNSCVPQMVEGTVTMGRNSKTTVTAVPEKGYRVNRILIGNTNYGKSSTTPGLQKYKAYSIDGNVLKDENGTELGSFTGDTDISGFAGLKTGKIEITGFDYDDDGNQREIAGKFVFERNADGTVDITLPNVNDPMHVHVDFGADYYFYKVWVGEETTKLNMTVAPVGFYPTEVTLPVPTGNVENDGTPITEDVKFTIVDNRYTATNGTYSGKVFTLTSNNTIEYVEVDSEGTEILSVRPNVVLLGNEFVHYKIDEQSGESKIDARYPITIEKRIADWQSADAKNFEVADTSSYTTNGYVTVLGELDENNTISPGNIVWQIKYPSEGVQSLSWPALPVEKEPANPNHNASNHNDRNYWFAIETVPSWAMASYDNTNALAPGVLPNNPVGVDYTNTIWGQSAVKDYADAKKLIQEEYKNTSAFLSVFKNGGEIKNVPAVVVRGRKVWVDQENEYNNRKDIWLHIDATIENLDGSKTTKQDVLPAQKVAANATGNDLIKTWGDMTVYDTGVDTVVVVNSQKQIPSNAILQANGSYLADNTYYWVNELKKYDANRLVYEYSIRETLDREGNQPVVKDNVDAGLLGYTSDDVAEWKEMVEDETTISTLTVPRYTGSVTNTLKRITYEATKVWDDNNDQDGYREDVTFVLNGLDTLPDNQEKEQIISADNNTTTVTWENLPKYKDSKRIEYSVSEEDLDEEHYSLSIAVDEDAEGNHSDTLTNTHIPETASISIFKKWDDGENQDNLRKEAAKVLLEGKTDSESQYRSAVDQGGQGITQGLVPVEDGLVITWLNIPVKRNGEDITYKIYEDINGLGGYYTDPEYVDETFTLTNGENKEATIKNIETPELTEVTITKEWDDMDNHDGIRPDSITVQLVKTYQKIQETTKTVNKQVTVNGEKYDVKVTEDGTEYFEINGQYYRGDEIKKIDGDVTNYEHLIPFNPDNTGDVLQEEKTVEVDGGVYSVRVTADGMEYYVKDGAYYSPEGNEFVPGEGGFNPAPEDEIVYEDLVIEVDGTEYQIKLGDLDGEEQRYYEKDGQYYDIFGQELIKFVPSDQVVQMEVPGEPEYVETEEITDIELTAAENWTTTITDLNVNEPVGQPVTYSIEEENVPEGYEVTITSTDPGKFTVINKHEVIINPPTAEPDETINYKGKTQIGTPTFTADPDTKAPGGGENKIERITLVDDDGNEVDTVTVPGEGTYVLNEDGTITFTPEPEFVGKTSGVKVRGYDSNGLFADTTYTPTVIVKVSYVDPLKGETVQGPEDSSVPGGTDITTTYEDTPGQESKNHPGYRFDGWEETIDPEDPSHYIRTAKYTPMYKIVYDPNGGTGTMDEDDYAADDAEKSHKSNTFTRKGYTFTGFKAYITDPTTGEETPILDESGNPIIFQDANDMAEYFKDMPGGTKIRMEAQWKRNEYHIHYDPNGGSGTMTSQDFTGDDISAVSKENTFTRSGFTFKGFLAVTKDGKVLGIFQSPADFLKYLEEQGDGGEVTLIAQWELKPMPAPKGRTCQDDGYPAGYYWNESAQKCVPSNKVPTPNTGDDFHSLPYAILLIGSILFVLTSASKLKFKE